jgi:hypothetical protein
VNLEVGEAVFVGDEISVVLVEGCRGCGVRARGRCVRRLGMPLIGGETVSRGVWGPCGDVGGVSKTDESFA